MREEWRDIEGYEMIYQVSNMGNVRSLDRIITKKNGATVLFKGRLFPKVSDGRYLKALLWNNGTRKNFSIHVLVAKAFIGDKPKSFQVDHINRNKEDNRAINLRYVTNGVNQRNKPVRGWHKNKRNDKYVSIFKVNGKPVTVGTFDTEKEVLFARYKLELELLGYSNLSDESLEVIKEQIAGFRAAAKTKEAA